MQNSSISSEKETILSQFQQLLVQHQKQGGAVIIRDETAHKANEQQELEKVLGYSVESIVKQLAELQLHFDHTLAAISVELSDESAKYEQLNNAINFMQNQHKYLLNMRIAAEALSIIHQQNEQQILAFEENRAQALLKLENEKAAQNSEWLNEQNAHELKSKEFKARVKKERQIKEADIEYEKLQQRTRESDAFAAKKLTQQKFIIDENEKREKDWVERKKHLEETKDAFEQNKIDVLAIDEKLAQACEKAKKEAEIAALASIKAENDLVEEEFAAEKKLHEEKLKALQETVARQTNEISELNNRLKDAVQQVHNFTLRSIEGAGGQHASRKENQT